MCLCIWLLCKEYMPIVTVWAIHVWSIVWLRGDLWDVFYNNWKEGAATGSLKLGILRNERAPVEESLCTSGMHCSSTYEAFEWMYVVCLPVCAAVVAALILKLWVLYWVVSKPSLDSKLSRMLLKHWCVRLRLSSNINSGPLWWLGLRAR